MEFYDLKSIAVSIVLVTVVTWAWSVLNEVWFRPKKLERYLRQQGLKGRPYRFMYGDIKENAMMLKEAKSKPLSISDDISPVVLPFLHKLVKDYGQNSFMWFGPVPRVTIMDPDQIKEIFTRINEFPKPKAINPISKLLATGLANYGGEKWTKHRRIINPAFHLDKLKLMLPEFYKVCSEMICKWEKLASKEGSCELDVWPYLVKLTGDVISRTAFGSNFEEGRRIFQLQTELADLTLQAIQSAYIPGSRFLPSESNKRMKELEKEIRALLMGIIKNREKAMKAGEATKNDLLGILMESNITEIRENGNNKNVGMTINDVIEECKLFYFAGQETTSVLLVWTLVLLSKHQNWQAGAREEVLRVFGHNKPNYDELNHLKIVSMILYEVLRLYPSVVMAPRAIDRET
ncbi:cytochrome P450 CYP72A219-like, partial [Pistacia vera]